MALPPFAPERTALVTGASSGIGIELARDLARRGSGVVLVARRADRLRELAAELGALGVRCEVLTADLADPAERAALPARVTELGLTVDILVNNAGLSTLGPVAEADPAAELNMIEVDVTAVADLCTRYVGGMVERGAGAVLNVASTAAFQPLPGQAGYGAAKAFVLSYTQALAAELRGTGVVATALCPGPVDTGFGDAAGFTKDEFDSALPRVMWQSAEAVARAGVEALATGRTVCVPGLANRVSATLAQVTPRWLTAPLVARRHPGLRRGGAGR